jgi:predicted nucleic acid-binding protein
MTTVVVDANVIVQGCLEAEGFAPLAGYRLVAPRILPSEVLSTLHELSWRREISPDLARRAVERMREAPHEIQDPEGLADAAWDVADSLGWAKTYDAEYVALARILDCPLLTLDARMARGAARLVQILSPAEL